MFLHPAKHRAARTRWYKTACSCVVAVAGAFAVLTSCGQRQRAEDPVAALKRFMAAVELGDSKIVWKYLGPRTRKVLAERARMASAQTVGTVRWKAADMISAGTRHGARPRWVPRTYKVIKKTKNRAEVEVAAPSPRHVVLDGGKVAIVVVSGSGRLVRGVPEPRFIIRDAWPLLGLTGVALRYTGDKSGRVIVGRKTRVELVMQKGKWRVELELAGLEGPK